MYRNFIFLLSLLMMLSSCGPKISEHDIDAASKSGALLQMYEGLENRLSAGETLAAGERKQFAHIGNLIAEKKSATIRRHLSGSHGLDDVHQAKADAEGLARFDQTVAAELLAFLTSDESDIKNQIIELGNIIIAMDKQSVAERMTEFKNLQNLWSTDHSDPLYQEYRSQFVQQYTTVAHTAYDEKALAKAQSMVSFLLEIEPNKETAAMMMAINKQQLMLAMQEGRFAEAVSFLKIIAEQDDSEATISELTQNFKGLIEQLISQGDSLLQDGKLQDAFDLFFQVKQLRQLLDLDQKALSTQESAFMDQMLMHSMDAGQAGHPGQALAYLLYVKNLNPNYPDLKLLENKLNKQVSARAIKRIAVLDFIDPNEDLEIGSAISARVSKYLFDHASKSIRYVARNALKQVLREQEINSMNRGSGVHLSAADFILQGKVTDATVESNKDKIHNTQRVTTGKKKMANPAHAKWLKLSSSKREDIKEPAVSIFEDIKENVSYDIVVHHKVGFIAASYSIVDASTSNVLFSEASQVKEEFESQSNDGIKLGDFELKMKSAKVPSDVEIRNALSVKLADKVGASLMTFIGNPELRSLRVAKQFAQENDYSSASESIADTYVVEISKGVDSSETQNLMMLYVSKIEL
ncbi:MAG: hypothetical protein Q9M31_07215 [Mariprofundus sp.]|nr:hypothetical protein [Mariprofundus sp.]